MYPVWLSLPSRHSISFVAQRFDLRMRTISLSQAMNLCLGRAMVRSLVLNSHPRMVLVSESPPSANNLFSAKGFSLGIGSAVSIGLHRVCIARGAAAERREVAFGMSGPKTIISSM